MNIKIAPSILAADFSDLHSEIESIDTADYLHLDIMDGAFVPNISFGPGVVKSLRKHTSLPFDTHLMINNPEDYVEQFATAGSDIITVHLEATDHLDRLISSIKTAGSRPGVSLNPATPLQGLEYVLEDVELVLIMTVNPGFGGQEFIPQMLTKVKRLREMITECKSGARIEVDGGINLSNLQNVIRAGADIIVAGSAIFRQDDPEAVIAEMREIAQGVDNL